MTGGLLKMWNKIIILILIIWAIAIAKEDVFAISVLSGLVLTSLGAKCVFEAKW